jgi:YaaC-like Protein
VPLPTARQFSGNLIGVPLNSGKSLNVDEDHNPDAIWELLHSYADVRSKGRTLFAGTLGEKNRYFDEFKNYIRQAHTYFAAAKPVDDASASLLYYCAFLQLAKAELLTINPAAVYQVRIGHGLSYRIGSAARPLTSRVAVLDGVFPHLYSQRIAEHPTADEAAGGEVDATCHRLLRG